MKNPRKATIWPPRCSSAWCDHTEFTAEGAGLSATPDLFSRLEADMSDTPDMVPALAVTAALAGIPFELSGVANLRHKGMRPACSLARRTRKK